MTCCATVRTACSSLQATSPATTAALARLAADGRFREQAGRRSLELVREWGYEPSVESFVAAVREAAAR